MKLYFQDKTLCLSSDQDLILLKVIKTFNLKQPILRACWRINKHSDPIFLLHFHNVHIMNVHYAKFQKKFDNRLNNFKGITLSVDLMVVFEFLQWVASIDLSPNEEAHANVVVTKTDSWTEQNQEVTKG